MFEEHAMLYLYVETPLHAGSGDSVGLVDLPIQRERVTNYPLMQASGIKGKLRAEIGEKLERENDADFKHKVKVVFGPDNDSNKAHEHAGALAPSDARLLLFPVRSLTGVFAWTTSRHALARFKRDLEGAGQTVTWTALDVPDDQTALTVDDKSVCAKGKVVLEEFAFTQKKHDTVKTIAEWLADNALPKTTDTDEYKWFRDKLKTCLVILPEDAFRDFTQFATEIVTRIRIDQEKKTVAQGALWTEEFLPADTVLYVPLHASRPRTETTHFNDASGNPSAEKVLRLVKDKTPARIQLGGDETVGRGIVKLHFGGI
jgi:CRISPR-associated protein Cmr4